MHKRLKRVSDELLKTILLGATFVILGGCEADPEDEHCQTPQSGCPVNVGWPSACDTDICFNDEECGRNPDWEFGICSLPCDIENDECPDSIWGLEGRCFQESFTSPIEICFVTGCEDHSECPEGMLCVGYAACPALQQCSPCDTGGPDCTMVWGCGEEPVPIEGKLCYPDNYDYY